MPLVLVIDDDHQIRTWIRDALEAEGLHIPSAADGRRGIQIVRDQKPALAVVDVTLPGMDGTAVSAALRAALGERFPIVLISADVGLREKAAKVGAAAYLEKPFGVDELIEAVSGNLPPT